VKILLVSAAGFGYLITQVPTLVLVVSVVCVSVIALLAILNESACDRLIRILKVLLGKGDNTQRQKRR